MPNRDETLRSSSTGASAPIPMRRPLSIGLAVALIAAALGVTLILQSVVSTAGYIFFYSAIIAASWFGGKWSGGLAVVLGILTVAYFFSPPTYSFAVNPESLPLFIEFAASAAAVSWFSSWRRQAEFELQKARDELQLRVEERTTELRESNEQLKTEMAERRRAEDAYYEAQAELARITRMSALGALAASISHEVNQPLAAVVTNADACAIWLAADPPNLSEARAALESIVQEGTRASDVVKHIRAMFTNAPPERVPLRIDDLIQAVRSLLQGLASRNGVSVGLALAPGLPPCIGDRIQLQQVVMNLVLNGIEAMQAVEGRPRRLMITSGLQDANELFVAVRDSGVGIAQKDLKRMFDPFFTTKAQGMGMGLSICHSVIESHGGRLWATANADHGATLHFTLPCTHEAN
jgi:C4-dicarboxylate-specific signal transduction histidine kinase